MDCGKFPTGLCRLCRWNLCTGERAGSRCLSPVFTVHSTSSTWWWWGWGTVTAAETRGSQRCRMHILPVIITPRYGAVYCNRSCLWVCG